MKVKSKKEIVLEFIKKMFFWLIGAFIVAVALEMFLLPNKIIDGGVIGISMMISYITKWNFCTTEFCLPKVEMEFSFTFKNILKPFSNP